MSISIHIFAVPAAIIALAGYVALRDDASFRDPDRSNAIQLTKQRRIASTASVTVEDVDPALRLTHARFGWSDSAPQASVLGRDSPSRPLGARSELRADWLATQQKEGRRG